MSFLTSVPIRLIVLYHEYWFLEGSFNEDRHPHLPDLQNFIFLHADYLGDHEKNGLSVIISSKIVRHEFGKKFDYPIHKFFQALIFCLEAPVNTDKVQDFEKPLDFLGFL